VLDCAGGHAATLNKTATRTVRGNMEKEYIEPGPFELR